MGEYLKFKRFSDYALPPRKAHAEDAGFDLAIVHGELFPAGLPSLVALGVGVELEVGEWGLLVGRSSTLQNYGLIVYPGVVDQGYTGELRLSVYNPQNHMVRVAAGTRLAQLIPMVISGPNRLPGWSEQVRNPGSGRGSGGFGSTGA